MDAFTLIKIILKDAEINSVFLNWVGVLKWSLLLKACVRFFYQFFYFFTKSLPFKNYEKCFQGVTQKFWEDHDLKELGKT